MDEHDLIQNAAEHLDGLLDVPRQIWLLGAGISKDAGIPLMYPLTNRVEKLLEEEISEPCLGANDAKNSTKLCSTIKGQLTDSAHIEHVLSQLGDLISLAERKESAQVKIEGDTFTVNQLRDAHRDIQLAIRHTVEFGYSRDSDGKERIGTAAEPIVDRQHHDDFVQSLFNKRRAGLDNQNPPVRFVTTNYDTLLEDALAHAHIACIDGFSGGATGFWDPRNSESRLHQASKTARHAATICKLHGSIDWVTDANGFVMRVRSSTIKPDPNHQLLIYPQATKYQVTQRDPFATLFAEFRSFLAAGGPTVLVICGYSFGDDHINEEIERALRTGSSSLTILALCGQSKTPNGTLEANHGLPPIIADWLQDPYFGERIIVAGSHGYYRKGLNNQVSGTREYAWWTFQHISKFLSRGAEAIS